MVKKGDCCWSEESILHDSLAKQRPNVKDRSWDFCLIKSSVLPDCEIRGNYEFLCLLSISVGNCSRSEDREMMQHNLPLCL